MKNALIILASLVVLASCTSGRRCVGGICTPSKAGSYGYGHRYNPKPTSHAKIKKVKKSVAKVKNVS
jgi:hypothetical protein